MLRFVRRSITAMVILMLSLVVMTPPAYAAPAPCSAVKYDGIAIAPTGVRLICGHSTLKLKVNPLKSNQTKGLPVVKGNITVDAAMWEPDINKISLWYTDSHGTSRRSDDTSWLVTRRLTSQHPTQLTTVPVSTFGD